MLRVPFQNIYIYTHICRERERERKEDRHRDLFIRNWLTKLWLLESSNLQCETAAVRTRRASGAGNPKVAQSAGKFLLT